MRYIIIFLIRVYQKFAFFIRINVCRFYPSCSEYMAQSIIKKGIIKGITNGGLRILRCNPFHPGGYDPVS